MATDLTGMTGKVFAKIRATGLKALDLNTLRDPVDTSFSTSITFGTAANQVDLMWHDERSLNASANEELDMNVLAGPHGSISFDKIKFMMIKNVSTTAAILLLGNATGTQFLGPLGAAAHTHALNAGDYVLWANANVGFDSSAGQNDFKILETAALAAVYQIVILGLSS